MRIPLSWLREFAQVPAGATAEDVMAELVKVGFEEEAVHRPTDSLQGPVVVGQVLSIVKEPQTNGKTINWCQVRVVPEGQEQTLTGEGIDPSGVQGIICGAHNFVEGDKVVVTLPGAVLPGDFQHLRAQDLRPPLRRHDRLRPRTRHRRGPRRHPGALADRAGSRKSAPTPWNFSASTTRPPKSTSPRTAAMRSRSAAWPANTRTPPAPRSPTRRPRCRLPAALSGGYGVKLNDDAPIYGKPGCDRFVARTVRGVDATRPTPPWMSSRLRLAGIRSISLPVDISNYVMLELGQPNHCYDLDKLSGDIVVRRAAAGEKITTLDDKERALDAEDLLITDDSGPIGDRRCHGRRPHRGLGRHHERPGRGRALRRSLDRPFPPPPQAAVRGVQALRTRRGLAGGRRRRPARGRPAGRTRRRNRRRRPGPTSGPRRTPSPSNCRPRSPQPGSGSTSPRSRSSPRSRTSAPSSRRTATATR